MLAAPAVGAQSLAELAKKEKERRNKNKKEGKEVQVINEDNLTATGPAFTTTVDTSKSSTSRRSSTGTRSGNESEVMEESEYDEPEVPSDIPMGVSPQEKIAIFQRMLRAHQAEINNIDEQIAKNNARLGEIEQELNAIGGGVNMPPPVPKADFQPRNPGDKFALEAEQRDLRQKNTQLEAEKKTKADQLRDKGRRAGIPASYLNF
jgi:hypothetical protein